MFDLKESRLQAQGSRLLHVAIPLRPEGFYSGSSVAGNQGSVAVSLPESPVAL
jgi:hypothetical protein